MKDGVYSCDMRYCVTKIFFILSFVFVVDLNSGRGRRDGLVTTAATPSPINQRRRQAVSKQASSVEEEEAAATKNKNQQKMTQLAGKFFSSILRR